MSFFPKLRFINSKIWKMKMEIYQEAFQWQILLDEDSQRYDLVQNHPDRPDVYDSYGMSQIWNFMASLRLWTMMLPDNFYRSTVDGFSFKCINFPLKLCHTDMVLDGPSDLNWVLCFVWITQSCIIWCHTNAYFYRTISI